MDAVDASLLDYRTFVLYNDCEFIRHPLMSDNLTTNLHQLPYLASPEGIRSSSFLGTNIVDPHYSFPYSGNQPEGRVEPQLNRFVSDGKGGFDLDLFSQMSGALPDAQMPSGFLGAETPSAFPEGAECTYRLGARAIFPKSGIFRTPAIAGGFDLDSFRLCTAVSPRLGQGGIQPLLPTSTTRVVEVCDLA